MLRAGLKSFKHIIEQKLKTHLSLEPILVSLVIAKSNIRGDENNFLLHVRSQSRNQKSPGCSSLQKLLHTCSKVLSE